MESIKIEGLRSLKNSGFVDIKPLTLLLGENSSGKSTFLRTFPLLRQSTESHTRGPILWYGSYVDFGSFDDALSNYSDDKSISFSFKIKSKSILSVTPKRVTSKAGILSGDIEATLKVVNDGRNGQTRVRSVQIKHNENEIEIIYGKGDKLISVISNGINLTDYFGSVIVAQEKSRFSLFTHIKFPSGSSTYAGFNDYDNPNLKELINNCVAEYAHGKSNLADLTQRMLRQQTMSLSDFVEKFSGISPTHTWKKKTSSLHQESSNIRQIHAAIFSSRVAWYCLILNVYITGEFKNLNYIAPLRATAERYYRNQDLSVNEVDFQGKNLAMFIFNLSDTKKKEYKQWLSVNFGFSIDVISDGGHLSLRITYENSEQSFNITDMGFGFSQILPIITQLWFTSIKDTNTTHDINKVFHNTKYLVIEQPELHLHPRLQAKMVDVFIKMINLLKSDINGINLKIIIETHSETIINQIGHRIRLVPISIDEILDGYNESNKTSKILSTIDKEDVSIVIFDKANASKPTSVTFSSYDSEGNLKDWPWGFFDPEFEI